MQNNIVFTIPTYTDAQSFFPKPVNENYDYWTPLIDYFLAKSDTFELHCWNVEIDTIEEIKKLHLDAIDIVIEEKITIIKGKNSPILSNYLLENNLNYAGEFKWFTVNLDVGIVRVFHSGHWGTEFFVPNVMEEDIEYIKNVIPNEAIFHRY